MFVSGTITNDGLDSWARFRGARDESPEMIGKSPSVTFHRLFNDASKKNDIKLLTVCVHRWR
jgi:hypothetical protein